MNQTETSARLMFEFYDINNDQTIERYEIDLVEESGNNTFASNFTSIDVAGAFWNIVDENMDGAIDITEFNHATNFFMTVLDVSEGQLIAPQDVTFFEAASSNKETMDAFDAMAFAKKIVGDGLKAYLDEL